MSYRPVAHTDGIYQNNAFCRLFGKIGLAFRLYIDSIQNGHSRVHADFGKKTAKCIVLVPFVCARPIRHPCLVLSETYSYRVTVDPWSGQPQQKHHNVLRFFGKYPATGRSGRSAMAQKLFSTGPGIFRRAERK